MKYIDKGDHLLTQDLPHTYQYGDYITNKVGGGWRYISITPMSCVASLRNQSIEETLVDTCSNCRRRAMCKILSTLENTEGKEIRGESFSLATGKKPEDFGIDLPFNFDRFKADNEKVEDAAGS